MGKKKDTRKYVTVSISREYVNDIDEFINNNPYGKIYSSRSDFIHKCVDEKLEEYEEREVRLETRKLKHWYDKNLEKLSKRGINSWEDLLKKAIVYSDRF